MAQSNSNPRQLDRVEYMRAMRECCTKNDKLGSEKRAIETQIADLENLNPATLSAADCVTNARQLQILRSDRDKLKQEIRTNEVDLGELRTKWTKYASTQWTRRYPRTGQPVARSAGSSPRGTFYTIDTMPADITSEDDLKRLRETVRLDLRECKRRRLMLDERHNIHKSKLRIQLIMKRIKAREWKLYDMQIDLSETLRVMRERAVILTPEDGTATSMEVDTDEATVSMGVDIAAAPPVMENDIDNDVLAARIVKTEEEVDIESGSDDADIVLEIDHCVLNRLRALERATDDLEDAVIIDLTIGDRRIEAVVLYKLEIAQPEDYNSFRIPPEYFPLPCGAIQELPSNLPRRLHAQVLADSLQHRRRYEP